MSGTGHSWKSEFEKRRGAFERKNESEGASEDESVLSRARCVGSRGAWSRGRGDWRRCVSGLEKRERDGEREREWVEVHL